MNDKSINPEGTNSEDLSGDDILQSSPHDGRENVIPDKGDYSAGDNSFADSDPDDSGKIVDQETHFETSERKEIQSKSLSMNPNPYPQKKNA
jgi:protease-4